MVAMGKLPSVFSLRDCCKIYNNARYVHLLLVFAMGFLLWRTLGSFGTVRFMCFMWRFWLCMRCFGSIFLDFSWARTFIATFVWLFFGCVQWKEFASDSTRSCAESCAEEKFTSAAFIFLCLLCHLASFLWILWFCFWVWDWYTYQQTFP